MIYNHKSSDVVQDVIVECLCPIIDDLADEFVMLRRCESLAIYAPSPIAREILGRILEEFDDVWVNEESRNELLYKDDNKVIITLCDDGMIFVESAYDVDGDIKRAEAVLNYVYDDFTNKEVEDIAIDTFSVLVFGFEEEEFEDEETEHKYTVNGKPVSVDEYNAFVSKFAPDKTVKTDDETNSTCKETFKVNGKCVNKDTFEKELAKFEDRYLDNIQDMLLRYCDFMDEWNDLLKLVY